MFSISAFKKVFFLLFALSSMTFASNALAYEPNYQIGQGIHDITGPAAEVRLMGFADPFQVGHGIHNRQWARTFIIHDEATTNRVVFVTIDAGMAFQGVTQAVLARLQTLYGNMYTEDNVVISATHTHGAVGGQSHYALYNLTILGHIEQAFDAQVDGIITSISKAHDNLQPGYILINKGNLAQASYNRSMTAYLQNPRAERLRHRFTIDPVMTVLRFQSANGKELGMLNWFATHPAQMGAAYEQLHGDNKGYAAWLFERKLKKSTYQSNDDFVAAFAISNAGDMSPNVNPREARDGAMIGPTMDRYSNVRINGSRQYSKALELYNAATEQLLGPIRFAHRHVDFSNLTVSANFTGGTAKTTCTAALGKAMLAGTEDGPGFRLLYGEGDLKSSPPTNQDKACHFPKPIVLQQGKYDTPWSPEVLPLSILKVGQLAIAAVPAEFTIMSGRRVVDVVKDTLGDQIDHAVIAGLSNAYSGYVTTNEEYVAQQYEGGSTHFGPWTLAAYQQSFYQLALRVLEPGTQPATTRMPVPFPSIEPQPRDLSHSQHTLQTPVIYDGKPLFKKFGDVYKDTKLVYAPGETASAVFWSGHPKNDLRTQSTFLEVQRKEGAQWKVIATDNDWNTLFKWKRVDGVWGTSRATIEWTIPNNAAAGEYRIVHYGESKKLRGKITSYSGHSRTFTVRSRTGGGGGNNDDKENPRRLSPIK